jgi:acyl-[acyl carrier protein]--UDP-N-acetylglucosamine O-acyltransferase
MEQNRVINYVSPEAKLGRNVKIWHFSYVGSNTEIGDNVSIGSLKCICGPCCGVH